MVLLLLGVVLGPTHATAGNGKRPILEGDRPNILFVLTDDLRWDDAGAFGNPDVRTPNIDELVREGKTFKKTFVSSPVCHPSRASFLSGLYPHQDGIVQDFLGVSLGDDVPTVASRLNELGYTTGFIGKAHPNGTPHDWHFQRAPAFELARLSRPARQEGRLFFEDDGGTTVVKRDTTRYMVDNGIEFMRTNRDEPWFLWLATNAPHHPYFFSDTHPYRNSALARPPGYPPSDPFPNFLPAYEEKTGVTFEDPDIIRELKNFWRDYYSLTSTMDEQLGRLFTALEETGQAENTVVVLTSDNGIMHGSHGFIGKAIWYEESTRVPTVVRWPKKVEPGTKTDALIANVDFVHTFVDLAGGTAEDTKLEGRSFLPVMLDQRRRSRGFVFSEARRSSVHGGGHWNMLRSDRFKYVQFEDREEEYLYDLQNDFHEQENLIEEVPPGIRNALRTMVKRFEESDTGAKKLGPHRLGAANGPPGTDGQCLIQRLAPVPIVSRLRSLREVMMTHRVGRVIVRGYYRIF